MFEEEEGGTLSICMMLRRCQILLKEAHKQLDVEVDKIYKRSYFC